MSLDLFNNLGKSISSNSSNNFIENFINELKNYLNKNSNFMYTLDRFEGNFAVLENRNTKEMTDIPISNIPSNAKEGDILKLSNGSYVIDYEETSIVSDRIRDKMDNLKKFK
mgnify:CR=1 FL=1